MAIRLSFKPLFIFAHLNSYLIARKLFRATEIFFRGPVVT
jgi:hypothetical protein